MVEGRLIQAYRVNEQAFFGRKPIDGDNNPERIERTERFLELEGFRIFRDDNLREKLEGKQRLYELGLEYYLETGFIPEFNLSNGDDPELESQVTSELSDIPPGFLYRPLSEPELVRIESNLVFDPEAEDIWSLRERQYAEKNPLTLELPTKRKPGLGVPVSYLLVADIDQGKAKLMEVNSWNIFNQQELFYRMVWSKFFPNLEPTVEKIKSMAPEGLLVDEDGNLSSGTKHYFLKSMLNILEREQKR